jgi:hypothetical protein
VGIGILDSALRAGFLPSELAYIKPATQCRHVQLISKYCAKKGITHRGIGPVVFYTGFTRECINGEGPSPEELLSRIDDAVNKISEGKKLVLVDGVGYPAVGSVVGISNAQVARRLHCPVIIVGKHGVGDAIDSFNLNLAYFEKFSVPVIGVLFNKVEEPFEDTKVHVERWFGKNMPDLHIYGFIPFNRELLEKAKSEQPKEEGWCKRETAENLQMTPIEEEVCQIIVDTFPRYVDVELLLNDLKLT